MKYLKELIPDCLGWVFCVDTRGIGGWVSEKYLKETGSSAVVIKDYDATELAVIAGEPIKVYYEEFGWCWSKNQQGIKGWVPKRNLQL